MFYRDNVCKWFKFSVCAIITWVSQEHHHHQHAGLHVRIIDDFHSFPCIKLIHQDFLPQTLKPAFVFRCGFRTDAPSGGRKAPQSRLPRRSATRGRAGRPRRTRWRTRSTISHWTPTLTTTRSDCSCANTAGLSPSCASGRTTSDNLNANTNIHLHTLHSRPACCKKTIKYNPWAVSMFREEINRRASND